MAQPEEIFRKQLDKIAAEENITDYHLEITPTSSDGANYMSINFRGKIISPNRPDLNLFAKVAFFSEAMRAQIPIDMMYEREITAYKEILARYEEIQEKYNIPKEERFRYAKLYASSSENTEECLIMEDLGAQGYRLFDRFQPLTWEYAAKGVEEIAKYHALSLAFRKEFPNEYEEHFKDDEELFKMMFDVMSTSFKMMGETAVAAVSGSMKERVRKFYEKELLYEGFQKYYASNTHGIIVHGDYRASNILFKRQV